MSTHTERVVAATRRSALVTAVFIALVTMGLLAAIECAARIVEIWFPPRAADLGIGFDTNTRLFVPSPDNPSVLATQPAKCQSFHDQRFDLAKPEGTLRVFALGGSSVNYLQYGLLGLDVRLEKALGQRYRRVEIINAGGLSYGSQRLVPIASEVLKYDPDLILLYCGHNEFEELEQLEFAGLGGLAWQQRLSHLAIFRLIRDRKAAWAIGQLQREHNAAILAHPDIDYIKVWHHTFTPEEVSERMRSYRRNLTLIARMCHERNVPLIIGTVPSNLISPSVPPEHAAKLQPAKDLYAQGKYKEGAALMRQVLRTVPRHQASDAENDIIRGVAREQKLDLADVESAVIAAEPNGVPGETLFKDECHLNDKGNRILIDAYEQRILPHYRQP